MEGLSASLIEGPGANISFIRSNQEYIPAALNNQQAFGSS